MLRAESLPALLGVAYHAFECALQVLRHAEDHAGPLLPAFVLAAAAAADGRDAVAADRSFPGLGSSLTGNTTSSAAIDVADQVAGLSLARPPGSSARWAKRPPQDWVSLPGRSPPGWTATLPR